MLIKYCILAFVIFSAVYGQNNLRVRRQGIKGGRQPSPSVITQEKIGGYGPQSSVGAPQRQRPLPRPRPQPQEEEGQVNSAEGEANPEPPIYGGVMGTPGVDFPGYAQIPRTNFKCSDYPYEPGMYADQETQCQAYHVCFQGRKESFLCGIGTVFNQAILACDYWHSVDCSATPNFYSVNEELGKAGPEPAPGQPIRPAPRPSSPQRVPKPSAPRPRPPLPSNQQPEYEGPEVGEPQPLPQQPLPLPQPRPQPPRYQPPASKVQPAFPQRPSYRPPASKVQPAIPQRPLAQRPEPVQRPYPSPQQPQPQRPYQPAEQRPYPQPQPQRPYPQPQPQRPYQPAEQRPQPQPQPQRPYQPAEQRPFPQPQPARPYVPRPLSPSRPGQQPIGKPSPAIPRPRPPTPIEPQIVQTQEEEPVDDSWLARESSQRQQSYDGY